MRHLRPAFTWYALALAGILAYALYLRLHGITWGLPFAYLDPDEGVIVREAFRIASGHPNPEFFLYPSGLFNIVALVYVAIAFVWHPGVGLSFLSQGSFVVHPAPYLLAARLLVVAVGVVSVYLMYVLGTKAFSRPVGLLAALFLAVVPLHVTYSHYAVTDVPATAFSLVALLLFVRAAREGSLRLLSAGAFVAGVAASTKYNFGMLLVPAAVAGWYVLGPLRGRENGLRELVRLAARRIVAPMAAAFFLLTPFALLDPIHFVSDFYKQNEIVRRGWLGFEHAGNGYWYNVNVNLPSSLGVVLFVLCIGGLAWSLYRRRRVDLVLAPYVVVYYLYVSGWAALNDRYLLPIVPVLVLLAARFAMGLGRLRFVRRRLLAPAVAGLLIVAFALPLSASIAYDRALTGPDVRSIAKEWVETHIKPGSTVAVEPYSPPLVSRSRFPFFTAAGHSTAYYRLVRLPLPLPGRRDWRHSLAFLRNHDVQYVIVSSEVYRRVLAAPLVYPRQVTFYERLAQQARLVKRFAPGPGERGPTILLYRLVGPGVLAQGEVAHQPRGNG
ncbi:MAG: glycosyltransferase family 39 protein [Thermoleophilia bacterium]